MDLVLYNGLPLHIHLHCAVQKGLKHLDLVSDYKPPLYGVPPRCHLPRECLYSDENC